MKTIKSVKVNFNNAKIIEQDDTVVTVSGMAYVPKDNAFKSVEISFDKDNCQIEYEPEKPTLLKRPDGSLISEPEKGTKITYIDFNHCLYSSTWAKYGGCGHYHLLNGLVFLEEDYEKSYLKRSMLSKQLEIKHEIDKLNAEQGWVPDWNDSDQPKHYLDINYNTGCVDKRPIITEVNYFKPDSRVQYAPYNVLMHIHKKYSQAELKQYLGIIE